METTFNNFLDFLKAFPDNEACHKHLTAIRWPDKPICPYCNNDKLYVISPNNYKCKNKECNKKFNVFTGSIFENTKIPLPKWFYAIYIFTSHKKGISSHQLAKDLGVTQKTAWFILGRVREMLKDKAPAMIENPTQIDETFIGGKAKNKHANKRTDQSTGYKGKTMVFGLLEEGKNVHTQMVENVDGITLKPIIRERINPGTTIVTDTFGAYTGLHKEYKHIVINHISGEYVRDGFTTNGLEGFWSQLKRGLYGVYHHASPKHLHRYCDEFAFRYNTRKTPETTRFNIALEQAGRRLRYNDREYSDNCVRR